VAARRLREAQAGDGGPGAFADIFAALDAGGQGGQLRQVVAASPPWITVPMGAGIDLITTPESPPDEASLQDFARAQGFDAAALGALFGTPVAGNPSLPLADGLAGQGAVVTAAHAAGSGPGSQPAGAGVMLLSASLHGARAGWVDGTAGDGAEVLRDSPRAAADGTAGADGVLLMAGGPPPGRPVTVQPGAGPVVSGTLVSAAAAPAVAIGGAGAAAAAAGADVAPAATAAATVAATAAKAAATATEASRARLATSAALADSGSLRGAPEGARPAAGASVTAEAAAGAQSFAARLEIAAGAGDASGGAPDLAADAAPSPGRELRSSQPAAGHPLQQALVARAVSSALVTEAAGSAVLPATLHAVRAGWLATDPDGGSADTAPVAEWLSLEAPAASGPRTAGPAHDKTGPAAAAQAAPADPTGAEALDARLGLLIAQRMLSGVERGQWQLRLLLRPESLGEVEIQMRMHGGALEAQLSAAQESTKDLLNQGLDRLRDFFQRSGMEVASLGVSAHSRGQGDGKPTGQSPGPAPQRRESGKEEEAVSVSPNPARGASGSQWDLLV
jgi:hypothetical protein